jgi:glucose/arabinose dehydrogenase
MDSRSLPVMVLILATCLVLTGCMTAGPHPPEPVPPTGMVPSPSGTAPSATVPGSPVDLTNQISPLAAVFRAGNSYTPLATPKPVIGLLPISGGLSAPMMIAVPDDGSGRMFVADQVGIIRVIGPDNTPAEVPFLDIRDRIVPLNRVYDERGLLSFAFHPDYRQNGRVFVYYTAPLSPGAPAGWCCTNRVSEFRVHPGNPDILDPGSERILLSINHPSSNHNGGSIVFGPDDRYLYIALGDGGGADDTGTGHTPGIGNAQDGSTLLGKIIRIDVDRPVTGGRLYAIPPDNPFINTPGFLPEIYAMGLRNPAYLSFDRGDGHHLIAAVAGQQLFESVFIIVKGGNYGWNIREGTHCFDHSSHSRPPVGSCPITDSRGEPLIGPIIELGHDIGSTVVGGALYRGTAIPSLHGMYIFGDWSGSPAGGGSILVATSPDGPGISTYPGTAEAVTPQDNRMWSTREFRIAKISDERVNAYVRWIGEGPDHEIYVLTSRVAGPDPGTATGEVWKIIPP